MTKCRICESELRPFLDLGKMPIANGFLTADQFASEYFYDLAVGFCPRCGMVQLIEQPAPKMMFHESYAFFSSTSRKMTAHFSVFAEEVKAEYVSAKDPFVVEIGSNDGIMLQHFAKAGVRHLGVEPSANVAAVAREKGIRTISEFFDEKLAKEIVARDGQADAFLGANVMCHIPAMHSVAEGIRILLKPQGVLQFEDPYLGDIVEKTSYDQIYDEHVFYFSVTSVSHLFQQHGMEVVDVKPQSVHGGSMRYVIAHAGARSPSPAVAALREKEQRLGLGRGPTYRQLRSRIEKSRDALMSILHRQKKDGRRVVGYAATSKSTTVTNYCGITPEHVEFISDTTPLKQGKFSPGAHIPVRPYEEFQARYPDFALLFGWNHSEEIMEKESAFRSAGGRWIVYVPQVTIQ